MKQNTKLLLAVLLSLAAIVSCSKDPRPGKDPYKNLEKVTYEYTDELFPNPERGFFIHLEISSSGNLTPLSDSIFEGERLLNRSLIYTIYYMPDFMECDITPEYLALIEANMQQMRKNGFKCVLRFAYKRSWTHNDHPWDPTQEVVYRHIDQLTPILQEYSDVIFCLEAGFIGVYGEWYYTDNFHYNPFKDSHYEPRRQLLKKLLEVMPKDRQIAVRYPQVKMKIFNIAVEDSVTVATAHNGTDISRVAHHNDCFVSSDSDVGTYKNDNERPYVYNETRYLIWGGESCRVEPYGTCENSIPACENHHMTYLNNSYHQGVIARWRNEGCYEEIDRRMGYRLYVDEAYFGKEAVAGKPYRVALKIKNDGFASPMNPRGVEFVLVGPDGKSTVYKQDNVDPRFWFNNEIATVDAELTLPNAAGEYTLYLNLPDGRDNLKGDPRYSIRLANKDCWEVETGYNKISTLTVK